MIFKKKKKKTTTKLVTDAYYEAIRAPKTSVK